jgi:3-phosphoshikimate 1-carboxyvinyltransferase
MESTSYVDLTLDILKKYGIEVENNHYHNFDVIGKQSYKAHDYEVEGDYSQAAFFLVANMLGADIKVDGLKKDSKQGDKKILEDIQAFNGEIIYDNNLVSCKTDQIYANQISFSNSPDLGPILSVLAALAKGRTEFIHAERLRLKECDRISCVVEELTKLGANVTETDDGMIFEGVNSFKGGVVDSHNDHRLAMAFAMASLKCEGEITILNAECVAKSYPDFFKVFESLGMEVSDVHKTTIGNDVFEAKLETSRGLISVTCCTNGTARIDKPNKSHKWYYEKTPAQLRAAVNQVIEFWK